MNNKITRRPYTAPTAEVVCFVPNETLASWKPAPWSSSDDSWFWSRQWGVKKDTLNAASITGALQWYDGTVEKNTELD